MVIGNHFMTILGQDCHIWKTALHSLLKQCDLEMLIIFHLLSGGNMCGM